MGRWGWTCACKVIRVELVELHLLRGALSSMFSLDFLDFVLNVGFGCHIRCAIVFRWRLRNLWVVVPVFHAFVSSLNIFAKSITESTEWKFNLLF